MVVYILIVVVAEFVVIVIGLVFRSNLSRAQFDSFAVAFLCGAVVGMGSRSTCDRTQAREKQKARDLKSSFFHLLGFRYVFDHLRRGIDSNLQR